MSIAPVQACVRKNVLEKNWTTDVGVTVVSDGIGTTATATDEETASVEIIVGIATDEIDEMIEEGKIEIL